MSLITFVRGGTGAGRKLAKATYQNDWNCPGCGSRLKRYWRKCPNCGHPRPEED